LSNKHSRAARNGEENGKHYILKRQILTGFGVLYDYKKVNFQPNSFAHHCLLFSGSDEFETDEKFLPKAF